MDSPLLLIWLCLSIFALGLAEPQHEITIQGYVPIYVQLYHLMKSSPVRSVMTKRYTPLLHSSIQVGYPSDPGALEFHYYVDNKFHINRVGDQGANRHEAYLKDLACYVKADEAAYHVDPYRNRLGLPTYTQFSPLRDVSSGIFRAFELNKRYNLIYNNCNQATKHVLERLCSLPGSFTSAFKPTQEDPGFIEKVFRKRILRLGNVARVMSLGMADIFGLATSRVEFRKLMHAWQRVRRSDGQHRTTTVTLET